MTEQQQLEFLKQACARIEFLYNSPEGMYKYAKAPKIKLKVPKVQPLFGEAPPEVKIPFAPAKAPATKPTSGAPKATPEAPTPNSEVPYKPGSEAPYKPVDTPKPKSEAPTPKETPKAEPEAPKPEPSKPGEPTAPSDPNAPKLPIMKYMYPIGGAVGGAGLTYGGYHVGHSNGYDQGSEEGSAMATENAKNYINDTLIPQIQEIYQNHAQQTAANTSWWDRLLALLFGMQPLAIPSLRDYAVTSNDISSGVTPWMRRVAEANKNA